MGYGLAVNLVKHQFEVFGFDIDGNKLDEAALEGIEKAKSVKEIAKKVETVILSLPHPKISKKVVTQLSLVGSKVRNIIDTSTLTPEDTSYLYKELRKIRINFLCAPMIGGKQAALKGEIHFLVEGDKKVFEQNKHIFKAIGRRTDYMGKPPKATLTKLAYNICRYSNVATAVEVSRLIRKHTRDTRLIYQILTEGSLDNFGQVWGEDIKEMMLTGKPYKPSKIPEKDLGLIIKLAKKVLISDKLFNIIRDVYKSLT